MKNKEENMKCLRCLELFDILFLFNIEDISHSVLLTSKSLTGLDASSICKGNWLLAALTKNNL